MTTDSARVLAQSMLEGSLPTRWRHVRGVAAKAALVRERLPGTTEHLEAAAWLHDIGYSEVLERTGFHPLDGARALREQGFPEGVVLLVAHHSASAIEARHRGLHEDLEREFPPPDPDDLALLTYCDMTVGPTGEDVSFRDRIAEIRSRYAPGNVVRASIDAAEESLRAAVERVEAQLADVQSQ